MKRNRSGARFPSGPNEGIMAAITKWMGERPQDLRARIQDDDSLEMALRRGGHPPHPHPSAC